MRVAFDDSEVMRREGLRGNVVLVDPPMGLADMERKDGFARGKPL